MSAAIIDTIRSLTSLMVEETRLLATGRRTDLAELAKAKLKLTTELEKQVSANERVDAAWQDRLPKAEKSEFLDALDEMRLAATENGQRLLRQIDLSRELMEAIAGEARRIDGHESNTYGAGGQLQRFELPAPIAVNARL